MSNCPRNVTPTELAELLGLTVRHVQRLAQEGVIVRAGRGRYDLAASVQGYVEWLRRGADDDINPPKERALLHRAQRERQEIAIGREKGDLVLAADCERQLARVVKRVAQTLETLPDTLERDVGLPGEAVERLTERLDQHREWLHQQIVADTYEREPEGGGDG
jgi:phage terminase Nu1 subunit (DNA packaging protein)